jgi:hypothetical protein
MSASVPDRFLQRIRAEYLEMPGLRLTQEQVERLCGVDHGVCEAVLATLVESNFLCVREDGAYGRVTDGAYARPRPARADLAPRRAKAS